MINPLSSGYDNSYINESSKNKTGSVDFKGAMEAAGSVSYDDIFERAARTYNVPKNLLVAIAKAESNFNPNCVSSCGAAGIMQLMPKTAEYLGVKDSFDPEQNIMGGAKYISGMLKKYDGDVNLALAAYNAGSGNVAKYGGIPPFKETQNYVVKVNQYMRDGVQAPDKRTSSSPFYSAPSPSSDYTETDHQLFLSSLENDSDFMFLLGLLTSLTGKKDDDRTTLFDSKIDL